MPNGSKNWVWTLNNQTQTETALLQDYDALKTHVSYIVIGTEVGEEGTPHLQGFVQFFSKKTMQQVKLCLQVNRMHLEVMKGSAIQASDYCKKDGNFLEFGELTKKGQRKDLEDLKKSIDSGSAYESLWDNNFSTMVQYRKGIQEYIDLKRSKVMRPVPRVLVFWGTTGTGKTRRAWAINPQSTWVYPGKGWFDGYNGQSVAIFDEFDGDDIKFALWKQLVDRYPLRVPIKGGYVAWAPEYVIFTSNIGPRFWWREERLPMGNTEQFDRRVERVVEMNQEWDPESDPLA